MQAVVVNQLQEEVDFHLFVMLAFLRMFILKSPVTKAGIPQGKDDTIILTSVIKSGTLTLTLLIINNILRNIKLKFVLSLLLMSILI
jgi:hypothetical protein